MHPLHLPLKLSEPVQPRRLSDDLRDLLVYADGRSLTFDEIQVALKSRGFAMLTMLLALPFVIPVSIPGLSVLFGIVIFIIGTRVALGQKPWLPQFVLRKEIKYVILEKIVHIGIKLSMIMEKVAKPRMHFLQRWPGMLNLIGAGIASGGLLLAQPLPLPLLNTFPGIAVVLLTAGMIERDGLLVLLGYLLNLFAWAYFGLFLFLGEKGFRQLIGFFN